jgi:hypothetical protein
MPRPPKENPTRRNSRVGPVELPAEGRKGKAPVWPLVTPANASERSAWGQLWATPQAVAWERLGWTRTVARYCRLMVLAELPEATAALLGQVTALEDRLGLTPKAMRLLLWRVVDDEVTEKRDDRSKTKTARPRLRAVDSTGA